MDPLIALVYSHQVRFSTIIQSENVFFGKTNSRELEAKLSKVFVRNNFTPERAILPIRPRKEVWGWFHEKIPTENVVYRMDETSLRDTFAPNRAI